MIATIERIAHFEFLLCVWHFKYSKRARCILHNEHKIHTVRNQKHVAIWKYYIEWDFKFLAYYRTFRQRQNYIAGDSRHQFEIFVL